jgi:hypothetical protein
MEWALALVALALLGVAAISQRLVGAPITRAMLFVAFGLVFGPEALDDIDLSSRDSAVRALAEATLALVRFCDASRIDLGQLRPSRRRADAAARHRAAPDHLPHAGDGVLRDPPDEADHERAEGLERRGGEAGRSRDSSGASEPGMTGIGGDLPRDR